jgi:hypothetical protein
MSDDDQSGYNSRQQLKALIAACICTKELIQGGPYAREDALCTSLKEKT